MMEPGDVDFIAAATLSGLDPFLFADTRDPLRMAYLRTISKRAIELDELRRRSQAQWIISELSKSLSKGSKQRSRSNTTSSTTQ